MAEASRQGGLGLRGKSLLALALIGGLILVVALLIGDGVTRALRGHFGANFARNYTLLNRERILAPLGVELALAQRFAASRSVRQMMRDPGDAGHRAAFFEEAEGYRAALEGATYFAVSAINRGYYFNDGVEPFSDAPRYFLNPDDPSDGWFFASIAAAAPYNINVNYDAKLGQTRVWINVRVVDAGETIGLAGIGIDFDRFLKDFLARAELGVIPLIVDEGGAIQAYSDEGRIALNVAGTEARSAQQTLAGLLPEVVPAELAAFLAESRADRDGVVLREIRFEGTLRVLAASHLPGLDWHVLTLLDPRVARLSETNWLGWAGLAGLGVMLVLLAGFVGAGERLVLRPLRTLERSAQALAKGDYALELPHAGNDEIGSLTEAFSSMAAQVRQHTERLESQVEERTAALQASHAKVAEALRKIDDSLEYASLIQRAILPDRELARALGPRHFVWWQPREVVGGDLYVFSAHGENFLLGLFDCAGHGVPGAMMTMLARAAFDRALFRVGPADPASVLAATEEVLGQLLRDSAGTRALATTTDAGLVYVDREAGELRFAGAAIDLFCSDGAGVARIKGSRRPLGDSRERAHANVVLPLARACSWTMTTDGLFDQAGGEHGFGLGRERFENELRRNASAPAAERKAALAAAVRAWQAGRPQRDDITVVSFRLD